MARKPAPTKAHETNKPTPTATEAIEPKPTFIVNGAPVTATALRPWTDAEMRLPLWLRANRLPRHVADPVEQIFLKDELPAPLANLWAMVHLARGAECGILTVRRDHGTKPDAMDPAVFVQNVVFMLRSARDDVLKQTAAANIPVVSARLDALIAATKATLDAFMAEQLDRIWCDNPTCDKRGRHLLPGPWIDAMKRSGEASEEAFRLSTFVGGDDADAKPNGHRRKLLAQDNGEYRPATWFRKGMADRLRQAASKKRKSKRVATRTIDGVVCYSVADARRWWPDDVPKEA